METQTEARSQTQAQSENAMERFVRKTRALFAQEPDLDKRWNSLRPILAELLADPEVIAASKTVARLRAREWARGKPAFL